MLTKTGNYLAEALEPSLFLGFLSALVGVVAAAKVGGINYLFSFLVIVGSVLAQISVNLMNDYDDYKSGIDRQSVKTKFSGGSMFVASGAVKHAHVLYMSTTAAALAAVIGVYLAFAVNLQLLVLIAIGAISIFTYTRYMSKVPFVSELVCALAFTLIAVGSYVVAHGSFAGVGSALFVFVPAGLIIGAVLLVNEVPDQEVDRKFGRKHAVVMLNNTKYVSAYYIFLVSVGYILILLGVFRSVLNPLFLLVFLTFPTVNYVAVGIINYSNPQKFEKYMGSNIMGAFAYLILLIFAYTL